MTTPAALALTLAAIVAALILSTLAGPDMPATHPDILSYKEQTP